jgi:hypothetical protein
MPTWRLACSSEATTAQLTEGHDGESSVEKHFQTPPARSLPPRARRLNLGLLGHRGGEESRHNSHLLSKRPLSAAVRRILSRTGRSGDFDHEVWIEGRSSQARKKRGLHQPKPETCRRRHRLAVGTPAYAAKMKSPVRTDRDRTQFRIQALQETTDLAHLRKKALSNGMETRASFHTRRVPEVDGEAPVGRVDPDHTARPRDSEQLREKSQPFLLLIRIRLH